MNIIYSTIRCGFSARNTEFVTKSLIYEIRFDGMSPNPFWRLQARRRIQRGTTPAPNEPTHTKTAAAITATTSAYYVHRNPQSTGLPSEPTTTKPSAMSGRRITALHGHGYRQG